MKKISILVLGLGFGFVFSQTKNIIKVEKPTLSISPIVIEKKDSLLTKKTEYKIFVAKTQNIEQYKILVVKPKDSLLALVKP